MSIPLPSKMPSPDVSRRAADPASPEVTLNHSHYGLHSAGWWRGASVLPIKE
jgi:hypothetical protein